MNKQIFRNIVFVGLFLVPFIPFLVFSNFFFPFITSKAFAWRIIIEIIFSAWLLLAFIDTDYRPKRSVILYAVSAFLFVIGVADLLGVAPVKSFWSNFERMEGFITLLHLGMFFLVISSVFKTVDWKRWWNTSLAASFVMVLYCVLQLIGLKTINQGGVRVDGTLGNAIYLAVYMLFHAFVALLFLKREWKNFALRWTYGLLILTHVFILYYTATRGAILGLLFGLFVIALLNINNKEDLSVRKVSIAGLFGLIILISGFIVFKDAAFIKNSPVLSRFSSLNTEEIKTQGRYFVWPMAIEGFKERPILGWGQENFNYIFNKYYDGEMFRLEPWFDRAHNIFLDWMVSGGSLGLVAYLSLYLALLYVIWKRGHNFSHAEKSILTGLIVAYFFHNFFVFDHLVSYILFFSLLSYLHSMDGGNLLWQKTMTQEQMKSFALPIIATLLLVTLYIANFKPVVTNVFLIEALKSLQTPGETLDAVNYFHKSYGASRLGRPEVVEHLAANSVTILSSDLPMAEKNAFYEFAKSAVEGQSNNSEDDARYQLITGSFLASVGLLDEAIINLNRAKELMPEKQQIHFEIGAAYINKQEPLFALQAFRSAYELAPQYTEAKLIYLVGAIYANDRELESEIVAQLDEMELVFDDRVINAYLTNKRLDRVRNLLERRIALDPENETTYREYLQSIAN